MTVTGAVCLSLCCVGGLITMIIIAIIMDAPPLHYYFVDNEQE